MKKKYKKKRKKNKKEFPNKFIPFLLIFTILLAGMLFESVKTIPVGASSDISNPTEIPELSIRIDESKLFKTFKSKKVKQDLEINKELQIVRADKASDGFNVNNKVIKVDKIKEKKIVQDQLKKDSTILIVKASNQEFKYDNNIKKDDNIKIAADKKNKVTKNDAEETTALSSSDNKITYIEILQNPNDIDLNLKYARQESKAGNYKQTIATLERLNMLYPDNVEIKLYLLSVLVQTDSPDKALSLIDDIKLLELTSADLETVNEIQDELKTEQGPKLWNFYASVDMSAVQSYNVNSVSNTGLQYSQDSIILFNSAKIDRTHSGTLGITAIRSLGEASSMSIGVSTTPSRQQEETTDDSESYGITLSLDTSILNQYLSPYLMLTKTDYKHDADSFGMLYGITNSFSFGDRNTFSYGYSYSDSTGDNSKSHLTANETNAIAQSYSLGHDFALNNIFSTSTSMGYTDSDAKTDTNDYETYDLGFRLNIALPFGNINIGDSFSLNDYKKVDTSVNSGILRSDLTNTFDIIFTKPIGDFFPNLDPNRDFFMNFSFDRVISESNLSNYDYTANSFSMSFSKSMHLNK